jgi:hypothetical protein
MKMVAQNELLLFSVNLNSKPVIELARLLGATVVLKFTEQVLAWLASGTQTQTQKLNLQTTNNLHNLGNSKNNPGRPTLACLSRNIACPAIWECCRWHVVCSCVWAVPRFPGARPAISSADDIWPTMTAGNSNNLQQLLQPPTTTVTATVTETSKIKQQCDSDTATQWQWQNNDQ